MVFQFAPYVFLYFGAALIIGGVTLYALREQAEGESNRPLIYFITLMGSALLWCVARALQTSVLDSMITWWFSVLVWIGWGGSVLSLLFFSLAYTGRGDLLTRRTVTALSLPVAVGILVHATNPHHSIFGPVSYEYWTKYGLWIYFSDLTTAYFVYAAYPHGIALYSVYRLVRSALSSATIYSKQAVAVAVGSLAPICLGTIFLFGEVPPFVPGYIDPTPLGFAITGLCLGYAIFQYGLLELVPIARRTTWDELEDAVITLDGQRRVIDANRAARELFDVEEGYVGKPAAEFFGSVSEPVLDQYEETQPVNTQVTLRLGGEPRHFSLSISPVDGDPNGQSGRVIVLREITSLKRRQEELELLRQVQSRVLRHNIRNEMTTIRGNVELLAERNGYDKPLVDVVNASEDLLSISRKARLVEEIVDSDARTVECDLREIIDETAAKMRDEYPDTEITVEGPNSCPVQAAPRLEIAIENLLENAAEHNDAANPRVSVRIEDSETPQLTIVDNGPGIPETEISVIQDKRETALEHGSGIGLWLVKWVVDRSDAQLTFETSEDGTAVALQFGTDVDHIEQTGPQTVSPTATVWNPP
jgi:PAS domain S-box-containing protein